MEQLSSDSGHDRETNLSLFRLDSGGILGMMSLQPGKPIGNLFSPV